MPGRASRRRPVGPIRPAGATLDSAGNSATDIGHHTLTVSLPGALPPNPTLIPSSWLRPDPQNAVAESHKTNNFGVVSEARCRG